MSAFSTEIAIIGGGPAGLAAAEVLSAAGHQVDIFDAMPSPGRKFLLAGIGGLNLTHSEPTTEFISRYAERSDELTPLLHAFGADALRAWAAGLGVETFVGSSGRVFPKEMKAAPLLRAWLHRLREAGVRLHVRHRWTGWSDTGSLPTAGLQFATPQGTQTITAKAILLALGGGSWARLGSDAAWIPWLRAKGVDVTALRPANCGFDAAPVEGRTGWSPYITERYAGQALKSISLRFTDVHGRTHSRAGEAIVTSNGLEGSLIYAHAAPLRDVIEARGAVTIEVDLAPGRSLERLVTDLTRPRGSRSLSSHLQGKAGLSGLKAALLRECAPPETFEDMTRLARAIKALPIHLIRPRPIDEAISTAGGVTFSALNEALMLRALPGVFCAGEMLDWEAPTGGYLLTGCIASGRAAGHGIHAWLNHNVHAA